MSAIKVLLAEDNPGDVLLVKEAFARYGIEYDLRVVRDGGEALNYVSHMGEPGGVPCPDVMLLDLNLPKADGPEILTEFRKHPACVHTPVIVITSSDAPRDRHRVAALGAAHYFRKPSSLEAFLELGGVVRDLLGLKDTDQAGS